MKKEVIERIKQLGGSIDRIKGASLQEDIMAIRFDALLYDKPKDTPWADADAEEPIYGLGDFIDEHKNLVTSNRAKLYDKIVQYFYYETEEAHGQMFWIATMFTPFKEGTEDFEEWNEDLNDKHINLSEITKVTGETKPELIQLFFNYGFPDHFYISVNDPNPSNPTVFGTDHEVFFSEITNEGTLEDFLQRFMTADELIAIVKKELDKK